jgi:hypothetical protein
MHVQMSVPTTVRFRNTRRGMIGNAGYRASQKRKTAKSAMPMSSGASTAADDHGYVTPPLHAHVNWALALPMSDGAYQFSPI